MDYIERMFSLLEKKGSNPNQLAGFIGVSHSAISQFRDGKAKVGSDTLIRILSFFTLEEIAYIIGIESDLLKSKKLTNTMIGSYQRNIQDSHVVNDGGGEEILKMFENRKHPPILAHRASLTKYLCFGSPLKPLWRVPVGSLSPLVYQTLTTCGGRYRGRLIVKSKKKPRNLRGYENLKHKNNKQKTTFFCQWEWLP